MCNIFTILGCGAFDKSPCEYLIKVRLNLIWCFFVILKKYDKMVKENKYKKMHKKSFIRWYVGEGLQEILAIWKRFIVFIPRLFSFGLLLHTLFAPWHRDVSLKNWRGVNPLRSAERILWNLFSRIIGVIVRLCVILCGVFLWICAIIFGGIVVFLYICAPGVLVLSFVLFFTSYLYGAIAVFVCTVVIMLFGYRIYQISGHVPYKQMDILEISQEKWFYRVYERVGVSVEDIKQNTFQDLGVLEAFLTEKDVTIEEFEKIIAWEAEKQMEREENARFFSLRKFLQKRPIGLNWHFGYTVNLDQYAQDFTRYDNSQYAHSPFHGFDQEMELLEIVLARPNENNIMITGQSGIGRHMIVHELARRIRTGYYDGSFMQYMRVMQCDFTSVMAQAKSIGVDPENIIHNLFHEAAYAGNVIFVVDNFEQYMWMNESRGFSFTTIIDQYASLPTFRMIGIATDEDFHQHVESNRVLMRHFDVIPVHEMSEEDAMKVLFVRFYGKEHTPFTLQSLRQILIAAERYTNTAPLPTRAINLAMEVLLYWQGTQDEFITAQTVNMFITEKTGMPVGEIGADEQLQLLSLEDAFRTRIIGQDIAVQTVASAVRRMRSGMSHTNRPAGSFLFLGPTGVGKTEMAKTVAQQYFGDQNKVIRIDMSEFQGPHALDRLIGSKELNQQGMLTTQAREHPYALLLLDEIDKADARVLDIFLQILDEGFVHDAFGRKVNFTTMIIIATSNAGSLTIKKMVEMGINPADAEKKVVDAIIDSGAFRAEFLNRFDDIVIFAPLTGDTIVTVARLLLAKFSDRVGEDQHISLSFDDDVTDVVIARGFDPAFGARSLVHYVEDVIGDALAKKLIRGNVHRGERLRFSVSDMDL